MAPPLTEATGLAGFLGRSSQGIVMPPKCTLLPGCFAVALSSLLPLFATPPVSASGLDGFWLSEGYGTLLKIDGKRVQAFEVTSISCLPVWSGSRGTGDTGVEAVLQKGRSSVRLVVTQAETPDTRFIGFPDSAETIRFHRLDRPPETFGKPVPNTPPMNFEIFWRTYLENYPFFSLRGVNWAEVRRKYRPRITDRTSPEELFGIFQEMIEPLYDAHTFVEAGSLKKGFWGYRAGAAPLDPRDTDRVEAIIEDHYLREPLRSWCRGNVSFGLLDGGVGYLRITAFGLYARGFEADVAALQRALDEALAGALRLKGLVIDVRKNDGGYDMLALDVAARLTGREYLAYSTKARIDPGDPTRFSKPQDTSVRVRRGPHFHGPVVLLTGMHTISGGEVFTMALMGRTPAVHRVGENTQGVFSAVRPRSLPNGWRFGLPNQVLLTKDGVAFDGPGIPPDIRVPVFSREDLERGRDGALEKALEVLSQLKHPAQGDRITRGAEREKPAESVAVSIRQASEADRCAQCANNLEHIGMAMDKYRAIHGTFPPAYNRSPEGKPLLSWRVHLLPFLHQKALYAEFHQEEPWDSPHNKALICRMPAVYACPSGSRALAGEGKTSYLTPRGPASIFPGARGIKMQEVTDGLAHTLLVVDASDGAAVPWTKPDDWDPAGEPGSRGLFGHHPKGTNFAFADGNVLFLKETITLKRLQALTTRNGFEQVNAEDDR
jgi:prepilin-type processing-associated H-X9-DG protein